MNQQQDIIFVLLTNVGSQVIVQTSETMICILQDPPGNSHAL